MRGLIVLTLLMASGASIASQDAFLRIRSVGDMMIANAPTNEIPQHFFFSKVAHVLRDADITFGNHEGTLCDQEIMGRKCKAGQNGLCYAFRSPTHMVNQFKEAGFDVLHLANNHIYDYYEGCADETMAAIEGVGLSAIGLLPKSRTSNGGNSMDHLKLTSREVRFGNKRVIFVGFHYSQVMNRVISIRELSVVSSLIKALDGRDVILVASMHAGAEGAGMTKTPNADEIHMGENRGNMQKFAKTAIDAGADLIIGHGPHVLRGMEVYNNKLIVYSLGNFATYTHFSFAAPMQLGAIVEAGLDEQGNFVNGEIFSTHQYWLKNSRGGRLHVELDLDSRRLGQAEIIRLSNIDFPNTSPRFESSGKFYPRNASGVAP